MLSIVAFSFGCDAGKNRGAIPKTHVSDAQAEKAVEVSSKPQPTSDAEIEGLIEAFASEPDDEDAVYQISSASQPIIALGPSAFPLLMKHRNDARYSFTRQAPSGPMRKWDVGATCGFIIAWELEVYEKIGVYPRMVPNYFEDVVDGDHWDAWWHDHQGKSLAELQIEATRWAIDRQQKMLEEWKAKEPDFALIPELQETILKNQSQLAQQESSRAAIAPPENSTPFSKFQK